MGTALPVHTQGTQGSSQGGLGDWSEKGHQEQGLPLGLHKGALWTRVGRAAKRAATGDQAWTVQTGPKPSTGHRPSQPPRACSPGPVAQVFTPTARGPPGGPFQMPGLASGTSQTDFPTLLLASCSPLINQDTCDQGSRLGRNPRTTVVGTLLPWDTVVPQGHPALGRHPGC